jgi:hypothetical protein
MVSSSAARTAQRWAASKRLSFKTGLVISDAKAAGSECERCDQLAFWITMSSFGASAALAGPTSERAECSEVAGL